MMFINIKPVSCVTTFEIDILYDAYYRGHAVFWDIRNRLPLVNKR